MCSPTVLSHHLAPDRGCSTTKAKLIDAIRYDDYRGSVDKQLTSYPASHRIQQATTT